MLSSHPLFRDADVWIRCRYLLQLPISHTDCCLGCLIIYTQTFIHICVDKACVLCASLCITFGMKKVWISISISISLESTRAVHYWNWRNTSCKLDSRKCRCWLHNATCRVFHCYPLWSVAPVCVVVDWNSLLEWSHKNELKSPCLKPKLCCSSPRFDYTHRYMQKCRCKCKKESIGNTCITMFLHCGLIIDYTTHSCLSWQ